MPVLRPGCFSEWLIQLVLDSQKHRTLKYKTPMHCRRFVSMKILYLETSVSPSKISRKLFNCARAGMRRGITQCQDGNGGRPLRGKEAAVVDVEELIFEDIASHVLDFEIVKRAINKFSSPTRRVSAVIGDVGGMSDSIERHFSNGLNLLRSLTHLSAPQTHALPLSSTCSQPL